ncbi:hypothetical protein AG0111_0g7803 [Alternaria gaisen]|jgi:hypothetical protein|uniref:Uncharacterized protein n=1 Tax=Alternaria gaisen TaxID=167740 RepID=A0ACB6FIH8_9PLEO|nr:hypothetical protein AG0111_0g7803 [Alternaria gaisen]
MTELAATTTNAAPARRNQPSIYANPRQKDPALLVGAFELRVRVWGFGDMKVLSTQPSSPPNFRSSGLD